MLSKEENDLLTRVGPGTPCGALLRRYWQPVAVAAELTAEKPTKRLRVMGEDLVAYRDQSGTYGLLAENCAHRGASLAYGFVEECGLRCPYHGWKYDAEGHCLEQPFEPAGSTYKERVRQRAYPVQKLAGLLWAYFGPQPAPLLPRWDVLVRNNGVRRLDVLPLLYCNWLQAEENSADVTHTYYLHGHTLNQMGLGHLYGTRYYYRPFKKYGFKRFEWGVLKYWTYGGDNPESAMGNPLIFPNILHQWEGGGSVMHFRVPIDDEHTRIFRVHFRATPGETHPAEAEPEADYWKPSKGPDGEYDLTNFINQDHMAWETQGPIYDRGEEHLGASDRGIAMYRQMLREQIEIVQQGGEPMALVRDPAQNQCIEIAAIAPGEPEEDDDSYSVIPSTAVTLASS
jgi:5,5'-dehydrodivanillate O-demethylase